MFFRVKASPQGSFKGGSRQGLRFEGMLTGPKRGLFFLGGGWGGLLGKGGPWGFNSGVAVILRGLLEGAHGGRSLNPKPQSLDVGVFEGR